MTYEEQIEDHRVTVVEGAEAKDKNPRNRTCDLDHEADQTRHAEERQAVIRGDCGREP